MKKIKIKNGKLFCYIEAQDVEMLLANREFVRPEVFTEESIQKGKTNGEGLFKIRDISNVHYVKSLPYIPNSDQYAKMDIEEHAATVNKATGDNEMLYYILDDHCAEGKPIEEYQLEILRGIQHVDQSMMETLIGLDVTDKDQRILACKITEALKRQSTNFLYPVAQMLYDKQDQQLDQGKGGKHLTLK